MQTPWFLGYLDLTTEADIAAIKRAYARLLKKIDQATDIDGFMRLHEAYRLAIEWSRRSSPEPAAPVLETIEMSGRTVGAPDTTPPPQNARHDATEHPRDVFQNAIEHPQETAARAIDALIASLEAGTTAQQALDEQLRVVRDGHLRAAATFEALLLDRLMHSLLPKRVALFYAAREAFAWSDITHLAQLGLAGKWLDQLGMELRAWQKECFKLGAGSPIDQFAGAALLERAALTPQDFNREVALNWPLMRDLLTRYPRYMALRYDWPSLQAWEMAYKAIAHTIDPHTGGAWAAEREKPGRTWTGPLTPALVCLAILLLIALLFAVFVLGQRPGAPAPTTVGSQDTESEAHRQRAAIPELPRNPPIDPRTCSYVERAVHAEGWNPPDEPEMRDRIRSTARACLNLGIWPNRHANDAQLQKLGIFEENGSYHR